MIILELDDRNNDEIVKALKALDVSKFPTKLRKVLVKLKAFYKVN